MPAPTESPAAAAWCLFARHRGDPFPFFLDRHEDGQPCFAGSRPGHQLVVDAGGSVRTWHDGSWMLEHGDPIERIAAFVERSRSDVTSRPAWLRDAVLPRTVGFLAYELGRFADGPPPSSASSASAAHSRREVVGTPLAVLSTYDEIDAWDPERRRGERVRFDAACASSESLAGPGPLAPAPADSWTSTSRSTYRRGFERIRRAIRDGDIYQANLSRRAVFDFDEEAADAYARLRQVQPVPWGAFLDFGGFALLSNSPECFLARRGDLVLTRPIKGTRRRREDPALDAAEIEALRRDPKEMAEHLMIVDLERSDLGRVARVGSVEVTSLAAVESFATVHHMVSEVRARLRQGTDLASLLRATFPGGSITGAPKIRAMEILAEVEDGERGPYTGAIGYFNGGDQLELAIAIRTAITSADRVLYSTGGGIVADSDPDREWDETELKLAALHQTLAGAPRRTRDSILADAAPAKTGTQP